MRENYLHKFELRNKFIFVPSAECTRRAECLIEAAAGLDLPDYYFHYRSGGHVAALHKHIQNDFFFRIDLKNFFYSISRNRVSRVLRELRVPIHARSVAEWSTVRSPYLDGPRYALPIGFVQSPLLASLALLRSPVAHAIEDSLHHDVFVSVYFDDLIGSAKDMDELTRSYEEILDACLRANLAVNPDKLVEPAEAIIAFNCDMKNGRTEVTAERIAKFFDEERTPAAISSFVAYCHQVARNNTPPAA